MNYVHSLCNAVSSFWNNFTCTEKEPAAFSVTNNNKRMRSDEENVISLNENSPPKRQKMSRDSESILKDRINLLTTSGTQTYSDFVTHRKAERSRSDDSWIVIGDDDTSLSPSKFKNTYKAPKHVRSPHKRSRGASMSFTSVSPTTSIMTVDLTDSPAEQDQPKSITRSNARLARSMGFAVGSQYTGSPFRAMSRDAYEVLLGSVISSSAKEFMRKTEHSKPRTVAIINLTDDDDDDDDCRLVNVPTLNLTERKTKCQLFNAPQMTSRSTPVVKPNIISIDDEEDVVEVSPKPQVRRVNSFQDRIASNRVTKSEMISNGTDSYNNILHGFMELKTQYEAKARCVQKLSTHMVNELLEKRLQTHLRITDTILIEEEEEEEEESVIPTLTKEMLAKVHNAQSSSLKSNEVLISKFKLDVRREDFMTLKNLNWLNDAIINFYMELIVERGGSEKKYPKVYAFSTFFFPALSNGYDRVKRYTRKVDLFSKDMIIVPVHLAVHWCLAKIDMKRKEIVYYDSMLGSNDKVLDMLLNYIVSEHKDKKKAEFDVSDWTTKNDKDIPSQKNGSDCGVFACTFAEYSSRRAKFNFSQTDMPYMRNKMCYEILTGKLLT